MEDQIYEDLFEKRGIDREVAEYDRGFLRYEKSDVGAVFDADAHLLNRTGWKMLAEARAARSGGIMMRRWAVPEGDPLILSEMRPDHPVFTGLRPMPVGHQSHEKMPTYERVDHVKPSKSPTTGAMVRDGLTTKEYENLAKRYPWCATHRDEATGIHYAVHDGIRLDLGADHEGHEYPANHIHINVAKYVFASQPSVWIVDPGTPHRHRDFWRTRDMGNGQTWRRTDKEAREALTTHVISNHGSIRETLDGPAYGSTTKKFYGGGSIKEWDELVRKYEVLVPAEEAGYAWNDAEDRPFTEEELRTAQIPVRGPQTPQVTWERDPATKKLHGFRTYMGFVEPDLDDEHAHALQVKDDSEALASRLSWHPYRREERWKRYRAFVVLEGCMKEAALVSADEATCSVPSVWQWLKAPEFHEFARKHLLDKEFVYVVCDSDGFENEHVLQATLRCVYRLQRLGVKAYPVAPPSPAKSGCIEPRHHDDKKHGVDDFIGPCNEKGVDDLLVFEREPRMGYAEWVADHQDVIMAGRQRRPRDSVDVRNALVLRWLAVHAGLDGSTSVALSTVAEELQEQLGAKSLDSALEQVRGAVKDLKRYGLIVEVDPIRERVRWHLNKRNSEWRGKIRVIDEFQADTYTKTIAEVELAAAAQTSGLVSRRAES